MSAPTLRIPESVADDPSDVADALEVAGALWGKGQSEEAIRWLRRAVAAASETDDAARAAGLAGAAADLEEAIKQPSGAPPAVPAPTESAAAVAEAKTEAATAANVAVPPPVAAPASVAPMPAAPTSVAPVAAAPTSASALAAAHAVMAPPTVMAAPHEPHDAAEATVPDSPAAMSAYANGASSYAPRPSSVPAPRSTFAKPPVIHPTHSPTALPDFPARMRVSVKTSVRDAGLLFVRALADGEEAPPGTVEAFLVREAPEADRETQSEGRGSPGEGAS